MWTKNINTLWFGHMWNVLNWFVWENKNCSTSVVHEYYKVLQYMISMKHSQELNLLLKATMIERCSLSQGITHDTICWFSLQVLNLVQSYVTLRVPLHVSYVFHSPVGAGGWQHFDLQSELRLTFVYDTAILWRDGIGSPPEAELQGETWTTVTKIRMIKRTMI